MMIHLSENIRRLRKEHSLTQEQLAEALGVTVGAVYKWEAAKATPDISLIVEMAAFFETSVDVLLGYELLKTSSGQAAEKLRQSRSDKRLEDGFRIAEASLQKYPNSFEVVYESSLLYYVSLSADHARRAIELFERAIGLLDQNTDERIGLATLQSCIAECYMTLGEPEQALELLKRNNVGGINSDMIGMILAMHCGRPDEAQEYLSASLVKCITTLYRVVVGYENSYLIKKDYRSLLDISLWFCNIAEGLRLPGTVAYFDKARSLTLAVCSMAALMMDDSDGARSYLRQARSAAIAFDSLPNYRLENLKYIHAANIGTAYDDMGNTAIEAIEQYILSGRYSPCGKQLAEMWEDLDHEEK